jgi:hypothetical protein
VDEFDRAHEYEEAERQAAIAKRKPTLTPCGQCFYCAERVRPGAVFCDVDCHSEHERERAIREAQGLR